MANISLDIKANTQKALGEFKKLSRELDNKFLVQGLKLDVVKSAFRDITKQFDAAIGEQGFKTETSTQQLRRNLALNLVSLKRFSGDVSNALSKDILESLRGLQAEGKITEDSLRQSLDIASFFDFEGSEAERRSALKEITREYAVFAKETKNLFDSSDAGLIKRVVTGQASINELFNVDFGAGGAVANRLREIIRDQTGGLDLASIDPKRRGELASRVLKIFTSDPLISELRADVKRENPFLFLEELREQLFSPEGVFGVARQINNEFITNFDGQRVERNLLQVTGKLLRTVFDPNDGVLAKFNAALSEVFQTDLLGIIVSGAELLTTGFEKLGEFFESESFKNFLNIFVPIQEAFDGILSEGFQFDRESINGFITTLFDAIRNVIKNVGEYINSIDKAELGSILGNVVSQIGQTLISLLPLIRDLLGAAIQTIGSSGALTALGLGAGALGIANVATGFLTKREGGFFGEAGRRISRRGTDRVRSFRETFGRVRSGNARKRDLFRPGGGNLLDILFGRRPVRPDYSSGNPDLARSGGFTGWQGEVIRKFNQIIIIMRDSVPVYMKRSAAGGGGFTTGMGGNPMGPFGPDQGDGRVGRADDYFSYQARKARVMSRRQASLAARGARRLPGRFGRMGRGLLGRIGNMGLMAMDFVTGDDFIGSMADDYMNAGTQYLAPIGPLPMNSEEPWAEGLGDAYEPRMISRSTAQNKTVMDRYNRRMAYRRSFRGRMGQLGRGVRGLGRLGGPVVGGLLTAFSLASLFGGSANASEMEGMTQEEKNEERRARDRQVIGGLAGIAGGAAGGALLGSAFGPVGTVLGGIIGGFVGEEAVKALSDPVIDGIGNFGRSLGNWFSSLWEGTKNLFGNIGSGVGGGIAQAWKGIVGFFGEEGPIQSTWRFFMDIPNKVGKLISEGWDLVAEALNDVPRLLLLASLGPLLGPAAGFLVDRLQGKALGGAGRGLTLVGENGPELVNLGSGSVVYPMTSFIGAGRGQVPQPMVNNVTININAPGAEIFAEELTDAVVDKLDEVYEGIKSLAIRPT